MAETKKAQNIRVVKDLTNPETPEILAASIVAISKAFKQLTEEGLSEKGITALLQSMPGMSKVSGSDIMLVLENLPKLSGYYIRAQKKK